MQIPVELSHVPRFVQDLPAPQRSTTGAENELVSIPRLVATCEVIVDSCEEIVWNSERTSDSIGVPSSLTSTTVTCISTTPPLSTIVTSELLIFS